MRIYMQSMAEDGQLCRYCQLWLQRDLLSGWSVMREIGRQGNKGRIRRCLRPDRDAALAQLMAWRDEQLMKGFRVVFVAGEGQDSR